MCVVSGNKLVIYILGGFFFIRQCNPQFNIVHVVNFAPGY
jgi:hypothetical protein